MDTIPTDWLQPGLDAEIMGIYRDDEDSARYAVGRPLLVGKEVVVFAMYQTTGEFESIQFDRPGNVQRVMKASIHLRALAKSGDTVDHVVPETRLRTIIETCTSFEAALRFLREEGEIVSLIDYDGVELLGRISDLTDNWLQIDEYTHAGRDEGQIQIRRDTVMRIEAFGRVHQRINTNVSAVAPFVRE